jgi:disulfide oxidoreductase YuzD
MNFSEILTFVRQRIKKLPESPFPHTYIYIFDGQLLQITNSLITTIDNNIHMFKVSLV